MVTKIVQEWEATIRLTHPLKWPVEDDEDKETFRKWLNTAEGQKDIWEEFRKNMRINPYRVNTDIEILELELKETEVKSTDTDPRV